MISKPAERMGFSRPSFLRSATLFCGLLLAAFVQVAVAAEKAVKRPQLALIGATIIDGTGRPPFQGAILIRGARIVAVGADIEIPDAANIIDLSGKTIIPGLIDMHGHLFARATSAIRSQVVAYPLLFLAGGVTTVRSPGDFDPEGTVALRERIERGEVIGPRIFVGGPYFDHAPSQIGWIEGVSSTEEALQKFAQWKERIDCLKVYTRITEDELRVLVEAAHAAGIPVTGHLASVTAMRAIELGIDGLEHGIFGMPELLLLERSGQRSGCPLAELDLNSPPVEELLAAIVEKNVAIDPTTVVIQVALPEFTPVTPDWLDYMSPEARAAQIARAERIAAGADSARIECRRRAIQTQLRFIKKLHDLGGLIIAGTDPVSPRLIPGYALHRELKNLVDAGLKPLEAIKAATLNAAIALRREEELGSIEPGKRADLVVVTGDPAANIEAVGHTELVFRDGVRYEPVLLRIAARGQIQ